ncbi:pirin family protein [Paenibacillus sp. GCM10027627]|uniref:pirin family protein n=1 Tax=unclassified Paenibacillus TaxID=185978 RepID=UPI003638E193
MIRKLSASDKHTTDLGWLRSHPYYSFGDYQDEARMGFGVMRVFNDDYLAPGKGFGAHPHSDMEIVSIVLSGKIRHEDNLGNRVVTGFGEVQRMSAGSGIIHTEFNASEEEELRLLQLWFMPKERGVRPSYEAVKFQSEKLEGALLPVVSNQGPEDGTASIGQEMTIYLSKLTAGQTVSHNTVSSRKLFLFTIEGELSLIGERLSSGDAAEIEDVGSLTLEAEKDCFFMLIDIP